MGVAMSADAFAAALGRGTALDRAKLTAALRIGAVFGLIESITPVVGWLIGNAAATMIQGFDHWVAFALLGGLGLHMIHAGLNPPAVPDLPSSERQPLWSIALTGFATSIDAMAVGVGLAFLDVNILMAAAIIGTMYFYRRHTRHPSWTGAGASYRSEGGDFGRIGADVSRCDHCL